MAKKRARHAGGAEIADDVLREAFARLPSLQDLLRCAATCRRWHRLVTNRSFLRRCPCVLAGIFSQNTYPAGPAPLLRKKKPFYSGPRFLSLQATAAPGTHLKFEMVVGNDDEDGLFDYARPLASRRGFLLVRLLLPSEYQGQKLHLAVCRPLLDRSTRLLPPPPFTCFGTYHEPSLIGCAILAGTDHSAADDGTLGHKQRSSFRVLLIYNDKKNNGFVCACTYSSDTGTWSAPVECCQASAFTRYGPQAGVVTHGTVHWLFIDTTNNFYTLNINIVTTHVSLTAIPIKIDTSVWGIKAPIPCIAGEKGRLSFVTIRHGVVELWTKQQYDHDKECEVVWQHSELTHLGSKTINLVFFAESRGALLVEQGGALFIVDLETSEKTQLVEKSGHEKGLRWFPADLCTSSCCGGHSSGWTCSGTPPVLYEIDWVCAHRRMLSTSSKTRDKTRVG